MKKSTLTLSVLLFFIAFALICFKASGNKEEQVTSQPIPERARPVSLEKIPRRAEKPKKHTITLKNFSAGWDEGESSEKTH
jgi:hypothetical protein